jgi:hypothetical protein
MAHSAKYKKGYREGYNNPSYFDQKKVMNFNDDLAKGIIDGIVQRQKDNLNDCVEFKK